MLETLVFWSDEVVARVKRGLFFGGSFCPLFFPGEGGVAVAAVSSAPVRLLLAVASSFESTSTKTSLSSSSCSIEDEVLLYPRPLSHSLDA